MTMIYGTCPWCDGPMAVGDDRPVLECNECSISVEFAVDPLVELAAAA
jgi:primosomal protein N'